jgi:hypothetical protein
VFRGVLELVGERRRFGEIVDSPTNTGDSANAAEQQIVSTSPT